VIASEQEDSSIEYNESTAPLLADHKDVEEKSNPDMDEGIGESETDIVSMADTAGDSAVASTMTIDPEDSETLHTNIPDCDPMITGETSDTQMDTWQSVGTANGDNVHDDSSSARLAGVQDDTGYVVFLNEFDESSSMKLADDDNAGLGEFTSDMLTSHSLSQDSSSSRTVEVGEEIRSPSPLGDDEYSDRVTPSSRTSPSPPITPPPVSPSPLAVSPNTENGFMSVLFACGSTNLVLNNSTVSNTTEEVDNSKDMATKKESNEDWDQELVDIRSNDEDLMTSVDQSRYFAVERTVFPLGYERSELKCFQ